MILDPVKVPRIFFICFILYRNLSLLCHGRAFSATSALEGLVETFELNASH
jgi:hypothetical protein